MTQAEYFVVILGLFSTVGGWLAGRNRHWSKAYRDLTDRYRELVRDLGAEIDRLHLKILDLEETVRVLRGETPER